jgi:hypothetical protein
MAKEQPPGSLVFFLLNSSESSAELQQLVIHSVKQFFKFARAGERTLELFSLIFSHSPDEPQQMPIITIKQYLIMPVQGSKPLSLSFFISSFISLAKL